jgi:hypothetical protein
MHVSRFGTCYGVLEKGVVAGPISDHWSYFASRMTCTPTVLIRLIVYYVKRPSWGSHGERGDFHVSQKKCFVIKRSNLHMRTVGYRTCSLQ